ncbi:hypothetical protein [Actinoplanes sp. NPDC049265]|uniref:hypothetical protein n=1 Tax=Actinoplanes sp. NPDC049265 TaxID=3363902 RepID=UPI00371E41AB
MNPFTAGTDDLERSAREWVFSPELRDLVAISGAQIPATGTREALAWLDDFSAAEWDFRAGRERSAMRPQAFEPGVAATITTSLRELGLAGRTTPAAGAYDRMLILGGGAPACVTRPAFAAALIAGGLRVGGVAALGSDRPLIEVEREFLAELGAAGHTEADAIAAGSRAAFGVGPVHVVRAIRDEGTTRANTADTYDAWRAADPGPHGRVLIVTTEPYVPFQHFDAVRKLGLGSGCSVETIGVPAGFELSNGFQVRFTLAHCLQEVRSAIRSLRRLLAALDGDRAIADSR